MCCCLNFFKLGSRFIGLDGDFVVDFIGGDFKNEIYYYVFRRVFFFLRYWVIGCIDVRCNFIF